ncbi:DUF480 domain-containing protein [Egicoccus sp. AB-alg2]|uniref:DUF480 domain-containing protein n=1 Tax=Egicoccus sp. AB-alg2 TaxID=3242693 RepID=UPI00359DE53D
MRLSTQGQRVLGCLVEKALATPDHYPLSLNALRTACNQTTGRDPVVDFDDDDVRAGLDDLKAHQLVKSEYARGSRVPKAAHRLEEQLDLDVAEQTVLGLLLLRGPQTPGELRSRAGRMHTFASIEAVEQILERLATHRFGAMVEQRPREPGRRETRWAHRLGDAPDAVVSGDGPPAAAAPDGGRYRAFHDAVLTGDLDAAVAQLADDVVFRSPAVHRPYQGRDVTARLLRTVATVFEDFRYLDVLDAGDRAGLVFEARIGDRQLQGWDYLRFDDRGRIVELTVMVRPLSGLQALAAAMEAALRR